MVHEPYCPLERRIAAWDRAANHEQQLDLLGRNGAAREIVALLIDELAVRKDEILLQMMSTQTADIVAQWRFLGSLVGELEKKIQEATR